MAVTLTALGLPPAAAAREAGADAQGFAAERLRRIGAAMDQEIAKGAFPGAVSLIARNGKIVYYEAHGFLDSGKSKPMPKDAVFRLASLTKPVVTVAAMMLVEQGKLKLNDPVAQYLPELKNLSVEVRKTDAAGNVTYETAPARPITVQDLMRHTAGFTYSFGGGRSEKIKQAYLEQDVEGQKTNLTAAEMLARLAAIPLAFQPGTTFEYGLSTDVLGLVLERVSGQPLDVLLERLIFKPLRMKDSRFVVTADMRHRFADAFDADPFKAPLWQWIRVDGGRANAYASGGGGMVGTAHDYYRFAQMILDGGELDGARLLSRKTVELMLSDHTAGLAGSPAPFVGPGYGFGLGFAVRQHDGSGVTPGSRGEATWNGITGTSFLIDPKEKIVGVFMSQGPAARNHTRYLFKNLLYGALVH